MDDKAPTDPTPMAKLAAVARQQAGQVAVWQARALGIPASTLHHRADKEGWTRPRESVLGMPGAPETRLAEIWVALLSVGNLRVGEKGAPGDPEALRHAMADVVAVTGFTVGELRGFTRSRMGTPQIVAPSTVVCRREGIRLVRSRRGIAGAWTWLGRMPVAREWRSLWDAAQTVRRHRDGVEQVADLAVFYDQTRRFAIEELIGLVCEPVAYGLPRRPPRMLARAAARLRPGFSHSEVEGKGRRIAAEVAAEFGLTVESAPYEIVDGAGVTVAEADVAIRQIRLDIEVDGPHHDYPSQQRIDRRRDKRASREGWLVVRFRSDLVKTDEAAYRQQLREVIGARLAELATRTA